MSSENSRHTSVAIALWILSWGLTYILLGFILVDRGFIAFVWPAHEIVVSILHADPSAPFARIFVAVFVGIVWVPLPLGIVRRKPEFVVLPFGILFATWFSGLLWGYAHVAIP